MSERLTIKLPEEIIDIAVDFSKVLAAGETLSSVESVTVSVLYGADPNKDDILDISGPTIDGTNVEHRIIGGVAETDYRILVAVNTSEGRRYAEPVVLPVRNI